MSAEEAAAPRAPRAHWIVWLFAIVGLGGIVAFILLVAAVTGPFDRRQPAKVAGTKAEETFTVGGVQPLTGTQLVQMDIAASGGSGSYSGKGPDVRNILLLDRRTGASRRILPDNSRRISRSSFLPAQAEQVAQTAGDALMGVDGRTADDSRAPPAYYLLEVEQRGNPELEDLLVGRIADGKQAFVMTGIDGVDSTWMDSPTRLGLIVREKLRLYYRVIDIRSLKVVENRPIAID